MSKPDDGPTELMLYARQLRWRYDALKIPLFAQAVAFGGLEEEGAAWWVMPMTSSRGYAENEDEWPRTAEEKLREGQRLFRRYGIHATSIQDAGEELLRELERLDSVYAPAGPRLSLVKKESNE